MKYIVSSLSSDDIFSPRRGSPSKVLRATQIYFAHLTTELLRTHTRSLSPPSNTATPVVTSHIATRAPSPVLNVNSVHTSGSVPSMSTNAVRPSVKDITTASTTVHTTTDIYILYMFSLNWSLYYDVTVYNRLMVLSVINYPTVSVMVIPRLSL